MRFHSTWSFTDIPSALSLTGKTLFLKLKHIPQSWQISIAIFLAGRVLFSLWGAVIWFMRLMPTYKGFFYFNIEPVLEGVPGALLGMWQRWDGIYYQQIAMYGYEENKLTAFFPLFPMLGRIVSFLTGNNAIIGLIIVSNLSFLLAIRLLYQIVSEDYTSELAYETLFCLIIFPSTFFFYSLYPQSLLLMFFLLAYWLARRGHWVWAGIACLGAGLTHSTAVALTLLLGWEAVHSLINKKAGNRIAMAIAPIMNLVGMGGFLTWRQLAGFPSYQVLQNESWARSFVMPWNGLAAIGKFIFTLPINPAYFMPYIYVLVFILIVGSTLWSFGRIPNAMWIYQAAFLGIILCTVVENDPLLGILRYPLVMFPIFLELAMLSNRKAWRLVRFFVFVLLSLVCSAWFFMWKFVA